MTHLENWLRLAGATFANGSAEYEGVKFTYEGDKATYIVSGKPVTRGFRDIADLKKAIRESDGGPDAAYAYRWS